MKMPFEFQQPPVLAELSPDELNNNIELVLSGQLPGFVVSDKTLDAFNQSVQFASEIGLTGGVKSTTMSFNYDTTSSGLAIARAEGNIPGPEEWDQYGITSLHADGEQNDEMLSISQCTLGSYVINIFNRGPIVMDDSPIELWDSLQTENLGILLDSVLDTDKLTKDATSLVISEGDTVIFNPSRPHMGITTQAPRRVNTTFFRKPF